MGRVAGLGPFQRDLLWGSRRPLASPILRRASAIISPSLESSVRIAGSAGVGRSRVPGHRIRNRSGEQCTGHHRKRLTC